jgi:hypothetical protein
MLLFIVALLILLVGFPLGRHIRPDAAGYHVVMFLPKNTLRRVERESALGSVGHRQLGRAAIVHDEVSFISRSLPWSPKLIEII